MEEQEYPKDKGKERVKGSDKENEVVDGEVVVEGVLSVRKGTMKKKKDGQALKLSKKWKPHYFCLVGGSLHCYKDVKDHLPKETIEMGTITAINKDCTLSKPMAHMFSVSHKKGELFLAADNDKEMLSWLTALEASRSKSPASPAMKKKSGRMQLIKERTTSKAASAAAGSGIGKRMIREKAPKEVMDLIYAIKVIVEKQSGIKKANEIEAHLLKLGVKIFLLVRNGRLQIADVLIADKPIRQALELFARCRNHVIERSESVKGRRQTTAINTTALKEKLQEVHDLVNEAAISIKKVLQGHLTPKNLNRVDALIDYVSEPELLYTVLMDRTMQDELYELVSAGEHYSQFHFYEDD